MKVSDLHQQTNSMQYVNQVNSLDKKESTQEAEGKSPSTDTVELSAQSKEMQKIYDMVQLAPDVRAEKVASLKKAIKEGSYEVDSEAVADKMIKDSIFELIK
jgi:negative regulator of flagellin synthesis FlgM